MDEIDYHIDNLEKLKYADLQKLAKKFGIKANIKGDRIITSLRELADDPKHGSHNTKPCTTEDAEPIHLDCHKRNSDSEVETKVNVKRGRRTKKPAKDRKRNQSGKQSSDDEEVQFKLAEPSGAPTPSAQLTPIIFLSSETPKSLKPSTPTAKLRNGTHGTSHTPVLNSRIQTPKSGKIFPSRLMRTPRMKELSKTNTPAKVLTPKPRFASVRSQALVGKSPVNKATPTNTSRSSSATKLSSLKASIATIATPSSLGNTGSLNITSRSSSATKLKTPVSSLKASIATPSSLGNAGSLNINSRSSSATKLKTPVSSLKASIATPSSLGNAGSLNIDTSTDAKNTTPQTKATKRKSQPEKSVDEVEPNRRRSRRDTYTTDEPSPGVKDIISSMKHDMTAQQQKETLMAKLDEKVQKMKDDVPTLASHIPRYTGQDKTEVAIEGKKKTPGKDWAKIHKRQWDKMDSIDDYLAKKRKRTESVTQSVKKLKLMTEQMRANLSSIKKPKTPVSHKKQSSVKKQPVVPVPVVKPLKHAKSALFQSPAPILFRPKILSTSKADFNFGKMFGDGKTIAPVIGTRKSPRGGVVKTTSNVKPLFTIGSNVGTGKKIVNSCAVKENMANATFDVTRSERHVPKRKSAVGTPCNQTANTSNPLNSRSKFDMTASLSRPVTWQTHKGKLKPFSLDTKFLHQTDVKEVKVKSREDRRREHMKQQRDNRKDNMSQRRELDV